MGSVSLIVALIAPVNLSARLRTHNLQGIVEGEWEQSDIVPRLVCRDGTGSLERLKDNLMMDSHNIAGPETGPFELEPTRVLTRSTDRRSRKSTGCVREMPL